MPDCPDCQSRDLKALRLARSLDAVTRGADANQVAYAAACHQAGARIRRELLGDSERQTELALLERGQRIAEQAQLSEGVRYAEPEPKPSGESLGGDEREDWWKK